MPLKRNYQNKGLITSLSCYTDEEYSARRLVPGVSVPSYNLIMKFALSKKVLKNIVKIIYDSELDPGSWRNSYTIQNANVSGTIYNNFFYYPNSSLEDIGTLVMNLYGSMFSQDEEIHKISLENVITKIKEMSSTLGGSTSRPFEIIESLNKRKILNTDFLKIVFNLKPINVQKMVPPTELILEDMIDNGKNRFKSDEDIERILRLRLKYNALDSANLERDTPINEERLLSREFRTRSGMPLTDEGYVSIKNRLRVQPRVDYSKFLSARNRSKRYKKLYKGAGVSYLKEIIDRTILNTDQIRSLYK